MVTPNSSASFFYESIIKPFIKQNFLDDNKFFFFGTSENNTSSLMNLLLNTIRENISKILVDSSRRVLTQSEINALESANSFNQFFTELISIDNTFKASFLNQNNIVQQLINFIVVVPRNYIIQESQTDKSASFGYRNTKLRLALFLQTFGAKGDVDNRNELYAYAINKIQARGLQYSVSGKNKMKQIWKEKTMVTKPDGSQKLDYPVKELAPSIITINKLKNAAALIAEFKSNNPQGPTETNKDYEKRVAELVLDEVNLRASSIRDILSASTPATYLADPDRVKWGQACIDTKVPLKYFNVIETPQELRIQIRHNMWYIEQYSPDLVRILMDLVDLQPLTRSKTIINEYDGAGELSLEHTARSFAERGELEAIQKDSKRFLERDKARFCFILDVSGSMFQGGTFICIKCGLPNFEARGDTCMSCGGELAVSFPFRYAQFLLTIMIYIFKDFMSEVLFGFIDDNSTFMYAREEYRFDRFEHYEKLIYYIWNLGVYSAGTNYYTLGQLFMKNADFFDGTNKKFVFVITDGFASDPFSTFRIKFPDSAGGFATHEYEAFQFLNLIAETRFTNFIYCVIQNHGKASDLGISVSDEPSFINTTITTIKLTILNIINSDDDLIGVNGSLAKNPHDSFKIAILPNGKRTVIVKDFKNFIEHLKGLIQYNYYKAPLKLSESGQRIYSGPSSLAYFIFLWSHWEKVFFTDYVKLSVAGEFQRFVQIVKDRNLLDIASNF